MTYDEAISYLDSFINYETTPQYQNQVTFKLERMRAFLSHIGDSQKGLKIIHVAGTKGKGSTACFIAHILKEEGFRVGLYTSPHLKDFRERIRILDASNAAEEKASFPGMILKNDFADILTSLKASIDLFYRSFVDLGSPTFFEILTAMALLYFKHKAVDFAVLETGLGGRCDATNAADSYISVITPIGHDHEHILGKTLTEIAFEKAGIMKSSNIKTQEGVSLCVSAPQNRAVREVLQRRAKAAGSVLFEMNKDFYYKRLSGDLFTQDFFYKGINQGSYFFKTRMLGNHQLVNASVAVASCEVLALHGIQISRDSMNQGIFNAFWPGRLEIIHTKPFIILDGAHNSDSTKQLAHFLEKEFKKFHKWLIFGVSQDKDIRAMAESLEPLADRIILTRSINPRAADPQKVVRPYFKKNTSIVTQSVEEALNILNREIKPEDVAVITGSLFVVGEARAIWQK